MNEPVKFPVFPTLTLTLEHSLAIARRHWGLVAVYVLWAIAILAVLVFALPKIEMGRPVDPAQIVTFFALFFLLWPLYGASLVILAIVTHNEILCGAGDLDSATLGRGGSRVFGYILDIVTLVFAYFLLVILLLGLVVNLVPIVVGGARPDLPVAFGVLGGWLVIVLLLTRMSLRLPGRAIGQALPWAEVWRLGRGNTWRLIGGSILLSLALWVALGILGAPAQIAMTHEVLQGAMNAQGVMKMDGGLPPHIVQGQALLGLLQEPTTVSLLAGMWVGLEIAVSGPASVIVYCAFLSVVYATLLQSRPQASPPPPMDGIDPTF